MKQAIVVRSDLKMSAGKIAAQAGHAAMLSEKAGQSKLKQWKREGQKKVVLKAKDLNHLKQVADQAKRNGVKHGFVRDAGMTELEPGTITCLSIGPDKDSKVDKVVGDLPLL